MLETYFHHWHTKDKHHHQNVEIMTIAYMYCAHKTEQHQWKPTTVQMVRSNCEEKYNFGSDAFLGFVEPPTHSMESIASFLFSFLTIQHIP